MEAHGATNDPGTPSGSPEGTKLAPGARNDPRTGLKPGGSRRRQGGEPRYQERLGRPVPSGWCRECGARCTGRKRHWCSPECVEAYLVRTDPAHARRRVLERDRGVCALCGIDCLAVQEAVRLATLKATRWWCRESGRSDRYRLGGRWVHPRLAERAERARRRVLGPLLMEAWWRRKTFWDADHVVPVIDGGGECTLANLRTLCVRCHAGRSRGTSP